MKHLYLTTLSLIASCVVFAQSLPKGMTPEEEGMMEEYLSTRSTESMQTVAPPFNSLRTAAEWEEVQSLVITWTGDYNDIQSQIVDAAQDECEVIIICSNQSTVKSALQSRGVPLTNLSFVQTQFNSIWVRDYGANSVYANDVDSLILVDWIYNRPRASDDVVPQAYAQFKDLSLYTTNSNPDKIMATGGNWMSDGFSTAFSSKLILDENDGTGDYGLSYPSHSENEINDIYKRWLGIDNYIKMTVLPYDDIHHIDMHMKLIDEERLLVGQFPNGTSDGPQLEANLQYILSNFKNQWGEPFKIVRIPMPPSTGGLYPPDGYYRTYANQTYVNKTILLPVYREEFDSTALRILQEANPGYRIVTIDVDNSNENLISQSGAIHCITHTIGVADPMWIAHQSLKDTWDQSNPYTVDALIKHRSGIKKATLYYSTTPGTGYTAVPMTASGSDMWAANIPAHPGGTTLYYYVQGEANNGKKLTRPITAPEGYWTFKVLGDPLGLTDPTTLVGMGDIYPNPASAITVIPLELPVSVDGTLIMYNMLGQKVHTIHEGHFPAHTRNYFINAKDFEPGIYTVVFQTEKTKHSLYLVIE
ncbi:MAG: agmatine deiminase family protein [Flavobacteriales bacterium]|nr:agmatine deiminase family protein [Flavobacteriales bacterium]